ncbi:hypothetical protein [Proteiniphilum acetatigenes]|uniref:hypothetical protein n=1 Tax=Proteiniphilum acetatigenes TaxID=294710 RepID=UPI0012FCB48E|nr:hypothetical protein [Proteiniphilum acetatigenes]
MGTIRYLLLTTCIFMSFNGFAQYTPEAVTSEWEVVSQGKLQKKPRFRDPMITVRFIYENGAQFMNLSLKYMFTDAVFEEAVPVEYFKDEKLGVETESGKYELKAARYAKARRMNTVAQKIADMRVVFGGNLSFLADKPVKKFVVHYAQGYQNIDLNPQEAALLRKSYTDFLSLLPAPAPTPAAKKPVSAPPHRQVRQSDEKGRIDEADTQQAVPQKKESIDELRSRAKKWNK